MNPSRHIVARLASGKCILWHKSQEQNHCGYEEHNQKQLRAVIRHCLPNFMNFRPSELTVNLGEGGLYAAKPYIKLQNTVDLEIFM